MTDFIVNNTCELFDENFALIKNIELKEAFLERKDLIFDSIIYTNTLKRLGPQKTFKKYKSIPYHLIDYIIDTGSYLFMRKGKVTDKPYYLLVAKENITTL